MLRRAVINPWGIVAGGLAGSAAWAAGVHPVAAAALGVLVAGVDFVAAVAPTRPDLRRPLALPEPPSERSAAATTVPGPAGGVDAGNFRLGGQVWRVGMSASACCATSRACGTGITCWPNPNREFHVLQLIKAVDGSVPAFPGSSEAEVGTGLGDRGEPQLDARAKAAYRKRVEDLREEVDEARRWNDGERAARAEAEIEALERELARAIGLGGRDRRTGARAEQARVNTTKVIRSAIDRIAEQDGSLGHLLDSTVHTGTYCVYKPHPDHPPPTWEL